MLARKPTSFWRENVTAFNENVVVAKTSYQMFELLSFSDLEWA